MSNKLCVKQTCVKKVWVKRFYVKTGEEVSAGSDDLPCICQAHTLDIIQAARLYQVFHSCINTHLYFLKACVNPRPERIWKLFSWIGICFCVCICICVSVFVKHPPWISHKSLANAFILYEKLIFRLKFHLLQQSRRPRCKNYGQSGDCGSIWFV